MKKINLYILSMGMLAVSSCESFLDRQPPHNLTLENSVNSYTGAENAINGMYSTGQNSKIGGDLMLPLAAMSGVYTGYYPVNYTMSNKQGNDDYNDRWTAMYKGVNAANGTIIAISALSDDKFPVGKPGKNNMVAEARLYRAWNYSWILWTRAHWWSTPDNPNGLIYRDDMSNLTNLQAPRLTVGESYAKIISDVDFAIEHASSFRGSKYLSKEMAMVLKAKLLLYRGWQNDYAEALKLVQALKSSAFIEPNVRKLYEDAWDSKEVLWSRYLESPNRTREEFGYSYAIVMNHKFNVEFVTDWYKTDPRYAATTGIVRSPEAWDDREFEAFTKLAHRGRVAGPDDKYATYYFRWSELYLMESELIARTGGSVADALKPLNALRAAKTSLTFPVLSANSLDDFYNILFKEICVELALENGSEWFASLRFMKNGKPWVYSLKPDVNFNENQYCWPIPDNEMLSNNQAFQNPDLK